MASAAEHERLQEAQERHVPWRKWGPYVSERQWGPVREDYSDNGDAWNYFTHDQARSRAYRWGEDGLAGMCDGHRVLRFALALWNGKDPILKERLFGLINSDGNNGEDVKEFYCYLTSTPTHSHMKYLYKYPQAAYPYNDLVEANRRRSRHEFEYELLDSGVFSDDRYFDVVVEYAKATPEDILIRISVHFNADTWLEEHRAYPLQPASRIFRNRDWFHMVNDDIISMPDKWEYPWYAAWDLAFHRIAPAAVEPDFAKQQLDLMLIGLYLHPNCQIPAYEWNVSEENPPVHAWATLFLTRNEEALRGEVDLAFLKSAFHKLLLNFTWWVNRKDRFGRNVFEGGFLGLDNIGVFDRSAPLPTGGYLEHADGTAWMALYCQNMVEPAVELAAHDPTYETLVEKFLDHYLWIAAGMNPSGDDGMWDEEDGFYYDILRRPDGRATRLKVRSMVGLLPLCATSVVEPWQRERVPGVTTLFRDRLRQMPELLRFIHPTGPGHFGVGERGLIALLTPERLRRVLATMLDEGEFLSPYGGIRSLSKVHERHPYVFHVGHDEYRVQYLPAESGSGMFGGNSNWRGPIWFPVNALIIRALLSFYLYYGGTFTVECPTGSGRQMNLFEVAKEIADRLTRIFLRDERGWRPVYGGSEKFQSDPHWHDHLLFFKYFHGDNGAGLGASHQTGWTGLVGTVIRLFGALDPKRVLEIGKMAAFGRSPVKT